MCNKRTSYKYIIYTTGARINVVDTCAAGYGCFDDVMDVCVYRLIGLKY